MPDNTLSQKTEQLVENLESKIKHIDSSDFRFYNIGRLPLLAKQTANHAELCSGCKENFTKIELLIDSLPECLLNPKDRKEFDNTKNEIAKHLEKAHNVRLANYHYSLFTFVGLVVGALLGYLLQIFYEQRLWTIFAILGAAAGAAYGKRVEWKRNKEKKLM